MPQKRALPARPIALLLTLALAAFAGAQGQYEEYRTKQGDTLASIARQYCTTWQDVYQPNQGMLGSDPSVILGPTC